VINCWLFNALGDAVMARRESSERKASFVLRNTFRILCRGDDHNEVSMKRTAPDEREKGFHNTVGWVKRERNRIFPKLFPGNLPGNCEPGLSNTEVARITVKRETAVAPDVSTWIGHPHVLLSSLIPFLFYYLIWHFPPKYLYLMPLQ